MCKQRMGVGSYLNSKQTTLNFPADIYLSIAHIRFLSQEHRKVPGIENCKRIRAGGGKN